MYDEFFSKAYELLGQDKPFATAVVVRAEKPTSAKPGDKAIITPDRVMAGWIGGSCAQPTVIQEAIKALADGEPRLIRLSVNPPANSDREGVIDLPMTCFSGGALEIYIEPHLPPPRLLIVGSLPVAQSLARLGQAMHYYVIAVAPDAGEAAMTAVDELVTDLKTMPGKITPLTYIVVASHGHYDELALEHALRSQAAYVALVASRTRAAAVLEYLQAQGLTEAELSRLKYPAGLDIQAMQGDEIALSIMAEIVQKRRNARPIDLEALLAGPEPVEAIDPVCGMAVEIATAEHRLEYAGQAYTFCAAGCLESFRADPARYLTQPPPAGEAIDPVCGMTVDIATALYMSEFNGQFYYFCAAGCKASFDKAPEKYLAQAVAG